MNEMQERIKGFLDERTQMLAAMSHDLRTALTGLRLDAEEADRWRSQGAPDQGHGGNGADDLRDAGLRGRRTQGRASCKRSTSRLWSSAFATLFRTAVSMPPIPDPITFSPLCQPVAIKRAFVILSTMRSNMAAARALNFRILAARRKFPSPIMDRASLRTRPNWHSSLSSVWKVHATGKRAALAWVLR